MKRIEGLFRWLNVLTILGTFLAYISPWINPARMWFFSFFGTGYSWLLLLNLLFILFWILLKRWYFLLSLGTILVGWNYMTTFVGTNVTSIDPSSETIKVMSYNIEGLKKLVNKKNKEAEQHKRDRFFKWINTEVKPDILCTQETGWQGLITQNTELIHQTRNQGVTIFSTHPIVEKGKINFPKIRGNACVWADIRLPDKTIIRVYSAHLQSNRITGATDKLIENVDLQEKETWLGVKSILGKYKRAAANRAEQAQLIVEHIQESPYPVILAGDFNETPLSYAYQVLATDMQDTFQEGAFGLGTTFSGTIPGLKIDYIFTDDNFRTIRHDIFKNQEAFSDHYPVLSEVEY